MKNVCHALMCNKKIGATMLMCKKHWFMVPKNLRDAIWETFFNGNRESHLQNCSEARRIVAEKEGIQLRKPTA
jgi:hypothetical protein